MLQQQYGSSVGFFKVDAWYTRSKQSMYSMLPRKSKASCKDIIEVHSIFTCLTYEYILNSILDLTEADKTHFEEIDLSLCALGGTK